MVSEACLISSTVAYPVNPRTELHVRPQGVTGRRRLPVLIDWDELRRLQEYTGMTEYACVRIMGYSLTSFYRHKKLIQNDHVKPFVLPKIIDVDAVEQRVIETGRSQRQIIKELGIPSTTFFRHKKSKDLGVVLRMPREGRPYLEQKNEHEKEVEKLQIRTGLSYYTCCKWIEHCTKRFYRHRKAKKDKEQKRHWAGVEIDWQAIDDMQRKTWIPGYKWMSRHKCALALGYKSTTYYRQMKLLNDDSRYDRPHETHSTGVTVRLEGGYLSLPALGL